MTKYVTPDELKAMLQDGGELALLDVREEGAHSQSHLFYAAPMPLSTLELQAEALGPLKVRGRTEEVAASSVQWRRDRAVPADTQVDGMYAGGKEPR